MPHARLSGDLARVTGFEKLTFREDRGTIVVLDCARTLDGQRLVFEVIVDEGDLRQDLLVEARVAGSGAVYVEMLGFGRPASTPLAARAVDHVAAWLTSKGLERIAD